MITMKSFDKYKKGTITIEIQSHMPEKFINLLWKNNINIKNIRKITITTMTMDINLSDFKVIEAIAHKTKTKIKITGRKGFTFFMIKMRRRIALAGGVFIFAFMLYYLSTFVWEIHIVTDHNLAPYDIRQQLKSFGIVPGIKKSKVNVYQLQETLMRNNDNLMYLKARIEGARLLIDAIEKIEPPSIVNENTPCNLVANKDGQIVWVYTTAGSAVVKTGDIVKAGQVIVKGEQGKEGSTYPVHAKGDVIARTFYEESKEVPVKGVKRERTGNKIENLYIEVLGKRIYLKNSLNKFKNYDKIVENKGFIKKDIYYDMKDTSFTLEPQKVIDAASNELYSKILQTLNKTVKIVDKKVESEPSGDNYKIRVLVVAEENIAVVEKSQ